MDNKEQSSAAPNGAAASRTSLKRILVLVAVGGVLAAGVYASPQLFIEKEPIPSHPHLKTCGTSVMSVMMENRWKAQYFKQNSVVVDYESTGSSAGIDQMILKKVPLAFAHAPMSDEQIAKAKEVGGEVVQIPIVICSVVPIYNVSQLKGKKPVNFTGDVLAGIFLGNIQTWNHPSLKAINPDLELPATPIAVVHRQDSSGTTLLFTDYLSRASATWREKFPKGAAEIAWPVGKGALRNMNLAVAVAQTDGAIGYVDLLYTHFHELEIEFGAVQNRDKTAFLRASGDKMTAAAHEALSDLKADGTFEVADKPGPNSYPIAGVIYAACYRKQSQETRDRIVDFLNWAIHEGQKFTEEMTYAPLPPELISRIDGKLKQIEIAQ